MYIRYPLIQDIPDAYVIAVLFIPKFADAMVISIQRSRDLLRIPKYCRLFFNDLIQSINFYRLPKTTDQDLDTKSDLVSFKE